MAATRRHRGNGSPLRGATAVAVALFGLGVVALQAATLPDDAAEIMFHSYDGGGVEVTGPALELRKSFARDFSASVNYYIDSISAVSSPQM